MKKLGLERTGHMSFLAGQDRTPKFAGQVLLDRSESRLIQGRHIGQDRQDLGLTLILKNRLRQRRRAAVLGVLSSLGALRYIFKHFTHHLRVINSLKIRSLGTNLVSKIDNKKNLEKKNLKKNSKKFSALNLYFKVQNVWK